MKRDGELEVITKFEKGKGDLYSMDGGETWLTKSELQAQYPAPIEADKEQPDIDEILEKHSLDVMRAAGVVYRRKDHLENLEALDAEAKQALYTRLAAEAVVVKDHKEGVNPRIIYKAVPLSKIKEMFGVPE